MTLRETVARINFISKHSGLDPINIYVKLEQIEINALLVLDLTKLNNDDYNLLSPIIEGIKSYREGKNSQNYVLDTKILELVAA